MEVVTESIYNLIPKPQREESKEPIYRSKYNPKAPLTGSTIGLHGTNVTVGKGVYDLKKVSERISKTNDHGVHVFVY